jgi:ubiquinone biosynthesis protein
MSNPLDTLGRIKGGAKRLSDVGAILAKYGLAEWLNESNSGWFARRLRGDDGERLNQLSTAERVRLALTEFGTTGIKLGQMLSTRPDLLGPKLTGELSKLQADTPPDNVEQVVDTVRGELGALPDEIFAEFELRPIASASIGQVHRATLQSGEQVVVKVMHQEIEAQVRRDLDIMRFLAELMEKHSPALRQYQPVATAKHFRRTLLNEMDYTCEARHFEEFGTNFQDDPTLIFPAVYREFSSRRVLTMDYLEGVPVSDREGLLASGEDLTEFARRGSTAFLEMIFRDGFYHADPHAGNLFLMQGNVVGVLDGGMIGRIDDILRDEIEALLIAAIRPDPSELVDIVCRLGSVPPRLDRAALRAELSSLLAEYANQPIDQFDLGGALNRITSVVRAYHIILPQGFVLLLKTLVMLEGTSQLVNPNFSLAQLLKPYCKLAIQRRVDPRRLMGDMARSLRDWRRLADSLPRDLGDIISRIRTENIEVHLEHRRLESTVERLVQGILASALFVGSALILSRSVPPVVGGISLFGIVGCLASIFLAARLLHAIRKSEKERQK